MSEVEVSLDKTLEKKKTLKRDILMEGGIYKWDFFANKSKFQGKRCLDDGLPSGRPPKQPEKMMLR